MIWVVALLRLFSFLSLYYSTVGFVTAFFLQEWIIAAFCIFLGVLGVAAFKYATKLKSSIGPQRIREGYIVTGVVLGLIILAGWSMKDAMRDYGTRSRVAEGMESAREAMTTVSTTFHKTGTLASNLGSQPRPGLVPPPASNTYAKSVTVREKGTITIQLTDDPRLAGARNGTVTLAPTVEDDHLLWALQCSFAKKWCPNPMWLSEGADKGADSQNEMTKAQKK